LLGGFWQWGRTKEEKEIKTTSVERKTLTRIVSLSGRVDAHEKATLKFQASGLLTWVGVGEGDWVKKGQAVASLDKRSLKKSLEKEMNDYMKYRWDWEQGRDDYDYDQRWFELSDEAKRILEKNQFDLNKAVLDVELADIAVRLATITTPVEGIVTLVEAPFPGVNVTPATAEFKVVNPASVYFYAEADEEEVVELAEGMIAEIFLDAYPDDSFSGVINEINFVPVSSTGSPSYRVKIDFLDFSNENLRFRMRMEGEADIEVATSQNVLVIPLDAVSGGEEAWVYLLKGEEKVKQKISVGLETDDEVEVIDGLAEGDIIVVE